VATHARLRRRLLASLIPREICEEWLKHLPPDLAPSQAEKRLRANLCNLLGAPAPLVGRGARVAAFVGPTGVGKTTTIAKLAAHATLVENRKIALVSLDDLRLGSTAQLRAYADVLGANLYTCGRDDSLARILASLRDVELVFIDTAGVSPATGTGLEALRARLRRAGESITTHLCVAAATRQEELDRILHVYGRVDPADLIATKLDEAVAIGSMLSARVQSGLPFSFLTTGQQVPEDLMTAAPESVTDILLGEITQ
jgi:flagellar biosynthesis protein FlhF